MITLVGDNPLTVQAGEAFVEPGATSDDPAATISSNAHLVLDTQVVGTYKVTYTATAADGLQTSFSRTINVEDTQDGCADSPCEHGSCTDKVQSFECLCPPQFRGTLCELARADDLSLSLVGGAAVTHEAATEYVDLGVVATDAVDGDVSDTLVVSGRVNVGVLGTYKLNYEVVNSAGVHATAARHVTVADTTDNCSPHPCNHGTCTDQIGHYTCTCNIEWTGNACDEPRFGPTLTLIGPSNAVVEAGTTYVDQGATAADVVGGNLSRRWSAAAG